MSINWEDYIELKKLKEVLQPKYEPLAFLGGGGFGKVFKVKDKNLDRECALKVLNFHKLNILDEEERKDTKDRFIREAKNNAICNHPNIAQIYETGGEDTFPYYTMQYIKGKNLRSLIGERGKLEFDHVLKISRDVLAALGYMHANHLVHRDLKPENIMIEEGTGRIVIIDFGFAKNQVISSLTKSGMLFGTPCYMPPEQWRDSKSVNFKADIYAYGVMLYEMITEVPPFTGSPVDVMNGHLNDPVPNLVDPAPGTPHGIEKVIKKAMAKDPGKRQHSAEELLNALKGLKTDSDDNNDPKPGKRILLFLMVTILIAGLIILLTQINGNKKKSPGTLTEIRQKDSHVEQKADNKKNPPLQTPKQPKSQAGETLKPVPKDTKPKDRGKLIKSKIPSKGKADLRSHYQSLNTDEVTALLKKRGFFDKEKNNKGNFFNNFKAKTISGDPVVIDHATNLVWHPSGSSNPMIFKEAKKWAQELNQKSYAGYSDWRLPTLEEAASLLETDKKNDLYLDTLFSREQPWIWTGDPSGKKWTWTVNFKDGRTHWNHINSMNYVKPVRSLQ
jgi:serine/threonine protein kinase